MRYLVVIPVGAEVYYIENDIVRDRYGILIMDMDKIPMAEITPVQQFASEPVFKAKRWSEI